MRWPHWLETATPNIAPTATLFGSVNMIVTPVLDLETLELGLSLVASEIDLSLAELKVVAARFACQI
jgi:hypothetical protein